MLGGRGESDCTPTASLEKWKRLLQLFRSWRRQKIKITIIVPLNPDAGVSKRSVAAEANRWRCWSSWRDSIIALGRHQEARALHDTI